MSDVVRVRLGCTPAFEARARHVLETAAAVWGVRLELVGADGEADLAYGAAAPAEGCPALAETADDPIATAFRRLALLDEQSALHDAWDRPAPPPDPLARPADAAIERLRALVDDGRRARGREPLETRPLLPGAGFAVALTHDIDTLRYFAPHQGLRLVREAARGRLREPVAAVRLLARGRVGARDPYGRLDEVAAVEREHGAVSRWYFLVRRSHALDGRDARGYGRRLARALAAVQAADGEVGLHGSTAAYESGEELARQRIELERLSGADVVGQRFHNLRFDAASSPTALERAGFRHDSSVGLAPREGFRAGTAFPFALWSLEEERPLDVIEVPLAAMDTTFLSPRYRGFGAAEAYDACVRVLSAVAEASGAASLLWHNSAFDDELTGGYGNVYRRLLAWIAEHAGRGTTTAEVADAFRARLAAARGSASG